MSSPHVECSRCKYNTATLECIHCYRDLCADCAEKGCCCRIPACVQASTAHKSVEGEKMRRCFPPQARVKREIKE